MIMSSFLDTLPDTEDWRTEEVAGIDPDLHDTGIAIITVGRSNHGRKRLQEVWMKSAHIDKKLRDLDAVSNMIGAIDKALQGRSVHHAIVESQQLYFRPDDTKAKVIGQGNDLLMLATISGAATAILYQKHADVAILKPASWKGQKGKPQMHERARELIKDEIGTAIGEVSGHCMDALCMALTEAGWVV